MKKKSKGFRGFYYFRIGYGTYLAIFIGVINVLTTTYFLAAKQIPWIISIFPTFESYIVFTIVIGIPIIVFSGWLHFKRIGTYAAEVAISQQFSPYNYKFPPGYNKEVYGPAYLAILKLNIKKAKGEKLTEDEIQQILHLENELTKLINDGYAGNPPRGVLE